MKIPVRHKIRRSSQLQKHGGFAIIDVIVSAVILAIIGTMAIKLSNSSNEAMQRMSLRSKVDSAVATRMEEIRSVAFRHLCTQGCEDDELGQELIYNTDTLEPLCENSNLGESLLTALEENDDNLTIGFNLKDYDLKADSIPINSVLTATGNEIIISMSESTSKIQITSTIVPHAHGWCP